MNGRSVICCAFTLLLLSTALTSASSATEDDVRCLRELKQALGDPNGQLSWNFSNNTDGFVCNFVGVTCWNPQQNRILSLSLPSMSLTGSIPSALQFCHAATTLDLSGNLLTGSIPPALCDWLPYLVNLDLSGNNLSGSIPPELFNCNFLNSLDLSFNSISGQIPDTLSRLDRLKQLDLSHNHLSGEIPASLASAFPSSSVFASNGGLCGRPVSSHCGSRSNTGLIIIIAAGIFGALGSLALAFFIWRCYFSPKRKKFFDSIPSEEGRLWAARLRASHNRMVPVSLFQKPIVKVKLADLLSATGDFHRDYVIVAGSERVGTAFKTVLSDGSALTVKRLHNCHLGEKQFRTEMSQLSQLRHPNLVPFLGFCVVEEERFLVYKYMPDGALSSLLQSTTNNLKWPVRLRIAIGTAYGLAWLHHGFQTPFLHQTISSRAILLDEDSEPRIIDFGLPRLVSSSPDAGGAGAAGASPFLNGDFGEFGYIPPEYASNPIATTKGDVYAFGVVLLELATGQKPTEVFADFTGEGFKGNLVDWINQTVAAGQLLDSVDRSLRGDEFDEEILQFLKIAVSCVAYRSKDRPSMYRIYLTLKSIGDKYNSSEQFEDFPLAYGKDDSDSIPMEL